MRFVEKLEWENVNFNTKHEGESVFRFFPGVDSKKKIDFHSKVVNEIVNFHSFKV
jgi:hypothetical protein